MTRKKYGYLFGLFFVLFCFALFLKWYQTLHLATKKTWKVTCSWVKWVRGQDETVNKTCIINFLIKAIAICVTRDLCLLRRLQLLFIQNGKWLTHTCLYMNERKNTVHLHLSKKYWKSCADITWSSTLSSDPHKTKFLPSLELKTKEISLKVSNSLGAAILCSSIPIVQAMW